MGAEELSIAMANKSLRTVKSELAFLADCGTITPAQLANMLRELPTETLSTSGRSAQPTPVPIAALSNTSLNEKQSNLYDTPSAPPPSYPAYPTAPPTAAPLCQATALYAYEPTDAGDLALQANDRVSVTEYMNADWWKGTNERTGQEGIFPRSYVKAEEKALSQLPPPKQRSGYGNMMTDVAGSGSSNNDGPKEPSKAASTGKKIGGKLGNAALFGAGATVGSKIVNGIF